MGARKKTLIRIVKVNRPNSLPALQESTKLEKARVRASRSFDNGIIRWDDLKLFVPLSQDELQDIFPLLRKRYERIMSLGLCSPRPSPHFWVQFNTPEGKMGLRISPHFSYKNRELTKGDSHLKYYIVEVFRDGDRYFAAYISDNATSKLGQNNRGDYSYYKQLITLKIISPIYRDILGRYLASLKYQK